MIIIPFLNGYFIGNIPNMFRQTHMAHMVLTYLHLLDPEDLPLIVYINDINKP